MVLEVAERDDADDNSTENHTKIQKFSKETILNISLRFVNPGPKGQISLIMLIPAEDQDFGMFLFSEFRIVTLKENFIEIRWYKSELNTMWA